MAHSTDKILLEEFLKQRTTRKMSLIYNKVQSWLWKNTKNAFDLSQGPELAMRIITWKCKNLNKLIIQKETYIFPSYLEQRSSYPMSTKSSLIGLPTNILTVRIQTWKHEKVMMLIGIWESTRFLKMDRPL